MTPAEYRIRLIRPDGSVEFRTLWAVSATNAYWMATELNPGCQVEVLGLEEQW